MSLYYPKDKNDFCIRNTRNEICHNCGGTINPGDGVRVENWDYPWDGSDTEGSITEKLGEWYEHPVGPDCLTAACASGHNLSNLLDIATGESDPEYWGNDWGKKWRDMARAAYNAHAHNNRELAEMIARGEEGAMREAGWGGIGGSQGRGE